MVSWEMRDVEKFFLSLIWVIYSLEQTKMLPWDPSRIIWSWFDKNLFFLKALGDDWISLRGFTAKVICLRNTRNWNGTLEHIDVFIPFLDSCPSKELRLENIASPFPLLSLFPPKCPQVILRISDWPMANLAGRHGWFGDHHLSSRCNLKKEKGNCQLSELGKLSSILVESKPNSSHYRMKNKSYASSVQCILPPNKHIHKGKHLTMNKILKQIILLN